ncbi:MAG: hypothetical protein JWM95_6, partial [Gemmatimonadetes bacterium]|nr:hypothetical protein [Gemmatimonadota bacterium]
MDDGTPIYPEGAYLDFVASGTWLKGSMKTGVGGFFEAQTTFSLDALLTTIIHGTSSQGAWDHSSNEGVGFTLPILIKQQSAYLNVPKEVTNCNLSAVTLTGTSMHTAGYAIEVKVGALSGSITKGMGATSRNTSVHCDHTPTRGDVIGDIGSLYVGQSGSASVFWHGENNTTVNACPTTWNAAPSDLVTMVPNATNVTITAAS